jgi:drug/metabolite transporter (DMT)-like permease
VKGFTSRAVIRSDATAHVALVVSTERFNEIADIMFDGGRNSKIALNFCCICLIWGSTFLAVKYAIETIPPFVVTAIRYVMASLALGLISRLRKESWLTAANLKLAAISGFLLSLGNALVCYSVTSLPTGLVAVVIGSLPAWIIVFDWQLFRGKPPQWGQVAGIVLSLIGVGALTSSHSEHLDMRNLLVWVALFSSIVVWAMGTLTQRQAAVPNSIFLFSSVQSLVGGLMIGATTAWDGSLTFPWDQISASSVLALLYLTLAGTVAAGTSYVWLSQNAEPRLVSTYALITPVVAVWLGWLVAGEAVTASTLSNSMIVLIGVALIAISGKAMQSKLSPLRGPVVLNERSTISLPAPVEA